MEKSYKRRYATPVSGRRIHKVPTDEIPPVTDFRSRRFDTITEENSENEKILRAADIVLDCLEQIKPDEELMKTASDNTLIQIYNLRVNKFEKLRDRLGPSSIINTQLRQEIGMCLTVIDVMILENRPRPQIRSKLIEAKALLNSL